jgi:Protein of unknown function (DUF2867)
MVHVTDGCDDPRSHVRSAMCTRSGDRGKLFKMSDGSAHVRATAPMGSTPVSQASDFACAYEVTIAPGDKRSSEQWARAIWEGAPGPLRWFMLAGWRFVLGLRLGPMRSPDHVLGWHIVNRSPDEIVCELPSRLLNAQNVFLRANQTLIWSTFVSYEHWLGEVIWLPVSVLHRVLVRIALRRAAAGG